MADEDTPAAGAGPEESETPVALAEQEVTSEGEPAPVPLDERKERRESTSAMWTRRFSFATLVVSIVVAGMTAWNAQQNMRLSERQSAATLAASEHRADEDFLRDQRTKAYASFVGSYNTWTDTILEISDKLSAHARGDKSVDIPALTKLNNDKLNALLTDEDLVHIVASGATWDTAYRVVDLVMDESETAAHALTSAAMRQLTQDEVNGVWGAITGDDLPEAMESFVNAGRKDLGIDD